MSILWRYRSNSSHVVSSETIELRPDLTYEEEPVEILAREVKELQDKKIPLSKCYGETTRPKKPRGIVKKRCGSNIRNCLTKVNFEDEIS